MIFSIFDVSKQERIARVKIVGDVFSVLLGPVPHVAKWLETVTKTTIFDSAGPREISVEGLTVEDKAKILMTRVFKFSSSIVAIGVEEWH